MIPLDARRTTKKLQSPVQTPSDPAEDPADLPAILLEVHRRLYQSYGPQGWWPGDGPADVIIGAILTQAAAWTNVEMAIANLKEAGCWSLEAIDNKSEEALAEIIRPSGYFNAKARKLKAFARHLQLNHAGDLNKMLSQETGPLRDELLSIHGVGPETADDIVLYAAGKPSFVIDSFTIRIIQRLGIADEKQTKSYNGCQAFFHENLPADAPLFNEYHALLDRHAKEACTKTPRCHGCCLLDLCDTGKRGSAALSSFGATCP